MGEILVPDESQINFKAPETSRAPEVPRPPVIKEQARDLAVSSKNTVLKDHNKEYGELVDEIKRANEVLLAPGTRTKEEVDIIRLGYEKAIKKRDAMERQNEVLKPADSFSERVTKEDVKTILENEAGWNSAFKDLQEAFAQEEFGSVPGKLQILMGKTEGLCNKILNLPDDKKIEEKVLNEAKYRLSKNMVEFTKFIAINQTSKDLGNFSKALQNYSEKDEEWKKNLLEKLKQIFS